MLGGGGVVQILRQQDLNFKLLAFFLCFNGFQQLRDKGVAFVLSSHYRHVIRPNFFLTILILDMPAIKTGCCV